MAYLKSNRTLRLKVLATVEVQVKSNHLVSGIQEAMCKRLVRQAGTNQSHGIIGYGWHSIELLIRGLGPLAEVQVPQNATKDSGKKGNQAEDQIGG